MSHTQKAVPVLNGLKMLKKQISQTENITISEALEKIAKELGFSTSNALIAKIKDRKSRPTDYVFTENESIVTTSPIDYFKEFLEYYKGHTIEEDTIDEIDDAFIGGYGDVIIRKIVTNGIEMEILDDSSDLVTVWLFLYTKTTMIATMPFVVCNIPVDEDVDDYIIDMQEVVDSISPDVSYSYQMDCVASLLLSRDNRYAPEAHVVSLFQLEKLAVVNPEDVLYALNYFIPRIIKDYGTDKFGNFIMSFEIGNECYRDMYSNIQLLNTIAHIQQIIDFIPGDARLKKLKIMSPDDFDLGYEAINRIGLLERTNGKKLSEDELVEVLEEILEDIDKKKE